MLAPLPNLSSCLRVANNLSDLGSASTARTNLGLGTAATYSAAAFEVAGAAAAVLSTSLQKASNLSDLVSVSTARTNLGLGALATLSSVSLASNVTGTLPVANGGTGLTALGSALQVLRTNAGATAAEWATLTVPTAANPTGTVGLTAVNGSASTFLRSDGAPALSQTITPTWTGVHTFQNQVNVVNSTTSGTTEPFLNVESQASATGLVARFKRTGGQGQLDVTFAGGVTYLLASNQLALCFNGSNSNRLAGYDATGDAVVLRPDTTMAAALPEASGVAVMGRRTYADAAYGARPFYLCGWSSTVTGRPLFALYAKWSDSTDATRKAYTQFMAFDTAAREAFRVAADGSRGYLIQSAPSTAPADAALPNSSVAFYDDGAGSLKIKLKDSGGTVRTATVTLT